MRLFVNHHRRLHIAVALAALMLLLTTSFASAQSATNATIRGKVTDETSGALPGVTVTITSPALIQGSQTKATDPEGVYTFPDLPIGLYTVTFELNGFQRLVREQIQLTAGFSATVNAPMKIGTMEESITVSGQSPVVDATNTTSKVSLSHVGPGQIRFNMDLLNVLNNASPWAISRISGPTYGQISSIDQPRIIHLGVVYSF